ncbi:trNA pseudouridine synthase A 1 [Waddlia chondrophila 2032/99]|uniref:tRNA pseudouridine synthase A n=1 Tax=Waddlia chondrophila 2032/99 TaxID=765953 RepID=F8LB99_9BACT|nr:trNA pseudouridine synthase A 1 [Waddlia chondrophila 2032/99]
MKKYKLIIAYDGTQYSGWQMQPNALSIQEVLEEKLKVLTKTRTSLTGAGRTDAGVHAIGQVAHFKVEAPFNPSLLRLSLNGLLPKDIRIMDVEEVPLDFHARYSATNKIYYYHLNLGPVQDPFEKQYSWNITNSLNMELLKKGISYLIGTHNFSAFANEANQGAAKKNPIRTLKRISVVPERIGMRLEFEGESFLYKMVRNMTGTLIDVAKGKLSPEEIKKILESKDRRNAGRAAPAKGLFLVRIDYASNPLKS